MQGKAGAGSMSLFQRRHFNKIAEIAAELDLDNRQMNTLLSKLDATNPNFSHQRFKNYVESLK
jgi:hypothetical protein|tara:strand:- start:441 stop:629 length:189 start_codon:yes stop_codon:yes gene_type:complete